MNNITTNFMYEYISGGPLMGYIQPQCPAKNKFLMYEQKYGK